MGLRRKRQALTDSDNATEHSDIKKLKSASVAKEHSASILTFENVSEDISQIYAKIHGLDTFSSFEPVINTLWKNLIDLKVKRRLVANYSTTDTHREAAECRWITESFSGVVHHLLERIKLGTSKRIAKLSLQLLFEGIKTECTIRLTESIKKCGFPLRQLDAIIEALAYASSPIFTFILDSFHCDILQQYADIRHYTLQSLETIIRKHLAVPIAADSNNEQRKQLSNQIFCILQRLPTPKDINDEAIYANFNWTPEGINRHHSTNKKSYQEAYCSCWMAYLKLDGKQLQLTPTIYKCILTLLPTRVLPFLSTPLILTKFFLTSFQQSDIVIAVQALSGLFYLLVKGRLGEPQLVDAAGVDFYHRLLSLLQPRVFSMGVRVRFLRLLQLALQSKLLSTEMLSIFIKKIVAVALLTPPSASLWLLSVALRLMQSAGPARMSSLIYKNITVEDIENIDPLMDKTKLFNFTNLPICNRIIPWEIQDVLNYKKRLVEDVSMDSNNEQHIGIPNELLEKMSLWEVEIAKLHWHPSVSQIAKLFNADMFKPNAAKVETDNFISIDTTGLLTHELKPLIKRKNKLKTIPLSFVHQSSSPISLSLLRAGCSIV